VAVFAEDNAGSLSVPAITTVAHQSGNVLGDVNGDGNVNLRDALIGLRICGGGQTDGMLRWDYPSSGVDVDGNGKVGIAEVVYALQKTAGLQ
jgi:hypothetical protein